MDGSMKTTSRAVVRIASGCIEASKGFWRTAFPITIALFIAACAGQGPRTPSSGAATTIEAPVSEYLLGPGDKLRVIVYGEQDLSGEFDVDGTGAVSLPLIGEVGARGKSLRELELAVANRLKDGYLADPRVNIEVLNYRPYYIIGEVEEPGELPYTAGMTVLNAVAVAGGYTYRADTTRPNQVGEIEYPADQSLNVQPGDIIRVPERFF